MVEGKTNSEIATILGLSPRTIEKHVHAILVAFQVENRATAIVRAMEFCAAIRHQSMTQTMKNQIKNEKALVPQGEQGLFLTFEMAEPRRLELLTF